MVIAHYWWQSSWVHVVLRQGYSPLGCLLHLDSYLLEVRGLDECEQSGY